jgi:hypothetical protein
VIAGVLGRAGEAGRKHRLALAAEKQYNFTPAAGLQTPGHLKNTKARYPTVLKLGGTIQELEEQDRGIVYDYKLDDDDHVEHSERKSDGEGDGEKVFRGEDGEEVEGLELKGVEEGNESKDKRDKYDQLGQGSTIRMVDEGKKDM